jgi:hypothetical protein
MREYIPRKFRRLSIVSGKIFRIFQLPGPGIICFFLSNTYVSTLKGILTKSLLCHIDKIILSRYHRFCAKKAPIDMAV